MFGRNKGPNLANLQADLEARSKVYYTESVTYAAKAKGYEIIDERSRRQLLDLAIVAAAKSAALQEAVDILKHSA